MLVLGRFSRMGSLAGCVKMQPLHVMGKFNISFHEFPASRYDVIGMFFLLHRAGKTLFNPFGYRIGHMPYQMVNRTFL
jgi:hypothetical protein